MLDKIFESCNYLLNNYPDAQTVRSYLDSRLNKDSQGKWRFGYFPNIENISAITDNIGFDSLLNSNLLYTRNIEDSLCARSILTNHFENHPLIMPFRNTYGEIVSLVGRSILDEASRTQKKIDKYKNTKASISFKKGNLLFGLFENKQSILDKGHVYVVEGQFDVIKASEIGFTNIVALGSKSMTDYQYSLISRYSSNIFLLLDNDEPGETGRRNILKKFGSYSNIKNFYIPNQYKDIDEYITKENITNFSEIIFSD